MCGSGASGVHTYQGAFVELRGQPESQISPTMWILEMELLLGSSAPLPAQPSCLFPVLPFAGCFYEHLIGQPGETCNAQVFFFVFKVCGVGVKIQWLL